MTDHQAGASTGSSEAVQSTDAAAFVQFKCAVCDQEPVWSWTDTHGVAQCCTCGTPYRIYHYDENTREPINKPPEICIKAEYIPLCREYWNTTHLRAPSGYSFPGGQELARHSETESFYAWMSYHAPPHTDAAASVDTTTPPQHEEAQTK